MSNDAFGNLGSEMRAMKAGRASLVGEIRSNHSRIHGQAEQLRSAARQSLDQAGKANQRLATQTRQMLARSAKDVKASARQTLAEAALLTKAIRKDVTALKAEAGRILADADGFLVDAGKEGAKRKTNTRKMLTAAMGESKGQTQQVLAEAAAVMRKLSDASRKRSAAWREIIRTLHGCTCQNSASAPTPASAGKAPAAKKPARRKTAGAARRAK